MRNPITLALALCLLLLAFVVMSDGRSDATPTIPHDLPVATASALTKIDQLPPLKFANFVSTKLPAAQPPESSDEPIAESSAGYYAGNGSSGRYGYGSYNSGSSSGAYGSYMSGSSSGAYGSYMSGSSSGSYSEAYATHHSGPVRGFFRNGGLLRRGRWQAHGPNGNRPGLFTGCAHCRS